MKLEEALDQFKAQMLDKFYARAEKHGDRSITILGSDAFIDEGTGDGTWAQLWSHFNQEVGEIRATLPESQEESAEAIDVANMAFLIWWSNGVSGG